MLQIVVAGDNYLPLNAKIQNWK